jgi:hypothetical protein
MILEPWKSAEEIDRRLSALNDPELAELLKRLNREATETDDSESYTSPTAPYWKKRIAFIALAGLFAMSAGVSASLSVLHQSERAKPSVPLAVTHKHPKAAVRRIVAVHHTPLIRHHAAIAPKRAFVASARPAIAPPAHQTAPAPNETLIRQARAQLLHERALAEQARADAARAEHQAQLAMQARAQAQHQAQNQALEQALAQARAEARAEAIAAQQTASAQAELAKEQEQLREMTTSDIKSEPPPTGSGRIPTYSLPGAPIPMPGPVDTNCTPHRGSFFGSMLDQVRVGPTTAGTLLRMVHP